MPNVSRPSDRVPVAPLTEAFLASGLPLAEVCRRLGRSTRTTTNLKRALGLAPCWNRTAQTHTTWARRIGYDHAVSIAAALGVDPVELDDMLESYAADPVCTCGSVGPDDMGNYDQLEDPDCPRHGPVDPVSEKEN